MPPRNERRQELIDFIQHEVDLYHAGEIPNVSTQKTLAEQFGYKRGSLNAIIRSAGIVREGTINRSEKPCSIPDPSQELSWFIGVLAGGGYVESHRGKIELAGQDTTLLEGFRVKGINLFDIDSTTSKKRIVNGTNVFESSKVTFNNTKAARFLGDLRRNEWPQTIEEQHPWILESEAFIKGLIEGFFDTRGDIYPKNDQMKGNHIVIIKTTSLSAANFLADMLTRLRIGGVGLMRSSKSPEGVIGVTIYNLQNIQLFAQTIRSVIPGKEAQLAYYRNRPSYQGKNTLHTEEELVQEWQRLTDLLGHHPTTNELKKLQKQGETTYSGTVFAKRFGDGSFVTARIELAKISGEEEDVKSHRRYRQYDISHGKNPVHHTNSELIDSWKKACEVLGHPPRYQEIDQLAIDGIIPITAGTYANRFGDGSFVTARENLERLIAMDNVDSSIEDSSFSEQGGDVFP